MKRSFLGALALLLFVSCGGDEKNPLTPSSLAGTYNLESISLLLSGVTISLGPPQATGTLILTETRYALSTVLSDPSQGLSDTMTEAGTYTVSGGLITFIKDGDQAGETTTISSDKRKITFSESETVDGQTMSSTIIFVRA